jgi:hypothetical protein
LPPWKEITITIGGFGPPRKEFIMYKIEVYPKTLDDYQKLSIILSYYVVDLQIICKDMSKEEIQYIISAHANDMRTLDKCKKTLKDNNLKMELIDASDEICCDGCGMIMGFGEVNSKIVLCSTCTPTDCSSEALRTDGRFQAILSERELSFITSHFASDEVDDIPF